jgi:hypothetical protein
VLEIVDWCGDSESKKEALEFGDDH